MASNFPGLGRYAAMGSILAARRNALASQNQNQGPSYITPTLATPGSDSPAANAPSIAMQAGEAPGNPAAPGDIEMPPMPVSSMIRDAAPKPTNPANPTRQAPASSMGGFIQNQQRRYRSAF